jgi:Beta- N-acetylglucosaminidase
MRKILLKYTYCILLLALIIPHKVVDAVELTNLEKENYSKINTTVNIEDCNITSINPVVGDMEKKRLEFIEEEKRKEVERKKQEELKRIQDNYDKACYYDLDDLSKSSNISVKRAYELLKDTSYQTWEMAEKFVEAEHYSTPVNAVFAISITRHESYHGYSDLAKNRNNITSWRNSDGSWRYFDSKLECVDKTENMISSEYLNPKGLFFNGKSIYGVGKDYCEGNTWAGYIQDMMHYITTKY